MLWKIICLISSFHVSYGYFDLESLRIQLEQEDSPGKCSQQYKKLDQYSLAKMIDSSSLKPEGILQGNLIDLGVFDECLSIANEAEEIYGKYCLASLRLDEIVSLQNSLQANKSLMMIRKIKNKFKELASAGILATDISSFITVADEITLAICIPDQCTNEDLEKFSLLKIDEDKCCTKFTNQTMDTKAIIAMSILIGILVIVICSTIYDVMSNILATKPIHQILIAFSIFTNGQKLFKYSTNSDQLECLQGIKALSMVWVILGHTYLNMIYTSANNDLLYVNDWISEPSSMFLLSATLSVDTFFTVGGLLTVYVFMRSKRKELKESFKTIPMLYLHRYIRLTPALAIMVLAYGSRLLIYLGDGPKWTTLNKSFDDCTKYWWTNLIYVQNYMPDKHVCVSQSWYLAVDFQLFILTPFLMFPLRKWPNIMLPFMSVLTVVGMIIPFFIGYLNKFSGVGLGMNDPTFNNQYYFFTYTRFSPYVIGMISGYFVHKLKSMERPLSFRIRSLLLLWALVVGGLLVCIFDGLKLVKDSNNEWADGFYLGFNRSAWSLMVAGVIMLCCTGNGGPINIFLSHPVFQIVSKLSYSMYLVHYIVILMIDTSSRTPVHFTNFVAFSQFLSILAITLIISVLYSLMFESPMIIIEKIIFAKGDKKAEIIEDSRAKA